MLFYYWAKVIEFNYALSFFPIRPSIMDVTNETMMLNIRAAHQSLTLNPGTISEVHFTINTLINNKNKPKVITVIGIVNTINIGLMKLFNKPITKATNTAVTVLSTLTPLNKKAAIKTATDVTNVFKRNLILNILMLKESKINCLCLLF